MNLAGLLWELEFMYVKCFIYSRCSINSSMPCHHCHHLKFSYLWMFVQPPFPHMKECNWKSYCDMEMWAKILHFFLFVSSFTFLLTCPLFTGLYHFFLIIRWQSFFQFHWEYRNNQKWLSRSSHHHICPSACTSIWTQMSSLL